MKYDKTKSKIMDTILSQSGMAVEENLFVAFRKSLKAEIHSFPTMYIKGGGSFGRWVKITIFLKKKCLKTAFLVTRLWIT